MSFENWKNISGLDECVNMTKQEMLSRIKILSDEIDANEDENRFMRKEIDDLYAKIDAGEFVPE